MWSAVPRLEGGLKRLGLIINPIAGLGGRVGLKGSDGKEIQRQALQLGAEPQAGNRAEVALRILGREFDHLEVISPPGEMGETILKELGFNPLVIGEITPGSTTAKDTIIAAKKMLASNVDLILFAGGDGTARDIYRSVGEQIPVLGIPAGVKIHSAVFATHPHAAGELAVAFFESRSLQLREAEVVDLDEAEYRKGNIITRLYGFLKVPYLRNLVQNSKAPTPAAEAVQLDGIARALIENLEEDCYYVLGPGTSTRAVADRLGFEKTLVGVDVVTSDKVVALDVNEDQLIYLVDGHKTRIIVTPIGGQGFLFGRGNQPISAQVIRKVGAKNIQVICTPGKLHTLEGRPLLVDTGDQELDNALVGYLPITTGYREKAVYRVGA